jgi:hypothetical protein
MHMRPLLPTLVLALTFVPSAGAYSPARPYSYLTYSPDGQFVFVMIGRYSAEEEPTHYIGNKNTEIKAIRDKWTVSGIYRNDGSVTPLWTVNWYSYHVDVPSDGEHVVRYRSGILDNDPASALEFYRHGELIASYELSQLVSFPVLIDHNVWFLKSELSDDSQTVAVETQSGERYVFDVQTGEMISRFRPLHYAFMVFIALCALGGFWLVRRLRGRIRKVATSA